MIYSVLNRGTVRRGAFGLTISPLNTLSTAVSRQTSVAQPIVSPVSVPKFVQQPIAAPVLQFVQQPIASPLPTFSAVPVSSVQSTLSPTLSSQITAPQSMVTSLPLVQRPIATSLPQFDPQPVVPSLPISRDIQTVSVQDMPNLMASRQITATQPVAASIPVPQFTPQPVVASVPVPQFTPQQIISPVPQFTPQQIISPVPQFAPQQIISPVSVPAPVFSPDIPVPLQLKPVVIPKTDLFVDPPKLPTLVQRLPPAVMIPTKAAEDEAMPRGAGQKRVPGRDVAPVTSLSPVISAAAAQSASSHGIKPSANVRSTLSSKIAQNPFDKSMTQGGPVPPPQWYVDNYMHQYDRLSGMGAVESSSSQNWGWVLAAGLAVSAAFFYAKSKSL